MAETEKKALIAQLALQRSEMTTSRDALQTELSLSRQLKKSVRNHPSRWVIGGAVTAMTLSFLFRRKKVIYKNDRKKRGLILGTARLAFNLGRPALTAFALKRARDYAEARLGPLPDNSMLGDPPQK